MEALPGYSVIMAIRSICHKDDAWALAWKDVLCPVECVSEQPPWELGIMVREQP